MIRRVSWLAVPLLLAACGGPSAPAEPAPRPEPPRDAPADTAEAPIGRPAPDEPEPEPELEPEPALDSAAIADSIAAADSAAAVEAARPEARRALPLLPGAVLPFQRIVAFYGSPVSTRMGILGELPPDEMLSLLDRETARWRAADPATPVQPALHLIAVMAAGDPGPDSLYRIRMPERHIERVMEWADRRDALIFLDIQPALSTVAAELPRLRKWLLRPDVHLALDPEWNMPDGAVPGTRIGTMSAREVNHAIEFLAELVSEHDLPPKVLVIHRFTSAMLRNSADIRLDPRVQVVINMDGWGPPAMKIQAYNDIVAPEADQYTGFKLFYKNDLKNDSRLLTPEEILRLRPRPMYIQYQ